jgi:RNA polymerase sigma-70 factor (ECF subfamily)
MKLFSVHGECSFCIPLWFVYEDSNAGWPEKVHRNILIAFTVRHVYLMIVMSLSEPDPLESAHEADIRLMLETAAGSELAFTELIHRHQSGLLNFFARMGVYNDAEDLVQETFIRVYKARGRYRPSAKFTTFLYLLARHVWADRGRKAKMHKRLEESLKTDAELGSGVVLPVSPEGMDVQAALNRLSPKLREVLVLNVYQGLQYQEIADVLEIPLGTVKSRINLALQELRGIFNEN